MVGGARQTASREKLKHRCLLGTHNDSMDLISSFSVLDLLAAATAFLTGTFLATAFWGTLYSNPLLNQTIETALMFLNNTKEVWEPVVAALEPLRSTLVSLTPYAKELVKATFKTALVLLVPMSKALLLVFRTMWPLVVFVWNSTRVAFERVRSMGMSFSTALATLAENAKEIGRATWTLTKSLGSVLYYVSMGVSYIVNSVEDVGNFLSRALFQPQSLTWQDVSDIAMPFLVVSTLFALLIRSNWKATEPKVPETKPLRRSERIARKRSFLMSSDTGSLFASCKKSSARSTNL
jgi:hypothetical protein